jgi:hypothetical protein
MMEAQLVTGATHDRRIFTGSAACAALAPMSAAVMLVNINFEKRMGFLLRTDFAVLRPDIDATLQSGGGLGKRRIGACANWFLRRC